MKLARLLLTSSSVALLALLSGCDVPPVPATLATNQPAVHKHHSCVYDTGSRVCREPDEDVDGLALGNSGSPDIQAARTPGVALH